MTNIECCPFYFVNVVWGETFIHLYLNINLPTLLAPGNLPAAAASRPTKYFLYTDEAGLAQMEGHPAFQCLRKVMPVEIHLIGGGEGNKHIAMSEAHRDFQLRAAADGAAAVYLSPDTVWADGAITALDGWHRAGKRVVFCLGMRFIKEAMEPRLAALATNGGTVIDIKPRELCRLGLNHLHPVTLEHFFEKSTGKTLISAALMWPVGEQGILAHCFHLHPLLVHADSVTEFHGTIDFDLVASACQDPDRYQIVTDSDDLLVLELSSLSMQYTGFCRKGSPLSVAAWALHPMNTNSVHWELVRKPIRIHAGITSEAAWQTEELRARGVMRSVAGYTLLLGAVLPGWRAACSAFLEDAVTSPQPIASADQGRGSVLSVAWTIFSDHPEPSWLQSMHSHLVSLETFRSLALALRCAVRGNFAPLKLSLQDLAKSDLPIWHKTVLIATTLALLPFSLKNLIVGRWPYGSVMHFDWLRQRALRNLARHVAANGSPALWLRFHTSEGQEGSAVRFGAFGGIECIEVLAPNVTLLRELLPKRSDFASVIIDDRLLEQDETLLDRIEELVQGGGKLYVSGDTLRRWGKPRARPTPAAGWAFAETLPFGTDFACKVGVGLSDWVIALDRKLSLLPLGSVTRKLALMVLSLTIIPLVNLLTIAFDRPPTPNDTGFGHLIRLERSK